MIGDARRNSIRIATGNASETTRSCVRSYEFSFRSVDATVSSRRQETPQAFGSDGSLRWHEHKIVLCRVRRNVALLRETQVS